MDISKLKLLKETDVAGKKILYRSPYDIGLKEKDGELVVKSDGRIVETIDTLNYLLEQGCSIGIVSWLKRPGGKVVEELRMRPVAKRLSELLNKPVEALDDCLGESVWERTANLKPGEIVMLENTRFYREEEDAEAGFAKDLTKNFDLIVYDAFPQAHRIHASTTGILEYLPACVGFAFEKEVRELSRVLENPKKPFVVVLGGAKVSDKVDLMQVFLEKADCVLVGGALVNTFLAGLGKPVGNSLVEDDYVDAAKGEKKDYKAIAKSLWEKGRGRVVVGDVEIDKLEMPMDLVAAMNEDSTEVKNIDLTTESIPDGWKYLDIGPKTIALYESILRNAGTIFMNGPMGLFEKSVFSQGTKVVAETIAGNSGVRVLAGGDTEAIVGMFNLKGKFTHVSTSGGAALDFLAGKEFPVLKYLIK